MQAAEPPGSNAGVSKWDIRKQIWDYMETNNLADFPRPVHHRIPNFKGSLLMSHAVQKCDVFDKAREVKVDPDKPLEGIRLAVLQARKTLLVPTPRLRTGLFNKIVPPSGAAKDILRKCATSQGVRDYSVPVGLDAKVHVDLVVVGSVAVSEKGWRIGKGEGFADMEYAMMVSMGAVKEDTVVITAVHDCQVVDIPEELLGSHDLTVDYILTPTRVIETGCKRPKPQGILWYKISHETLGKIPILKNLRYQEKQAGRDVTLKDEWPDVAAAGKAERTASKMRPESPWLQNETSLAQARSGEEPLFDPLHQPASPTTVYVGNIPPGTRVRELKDALRERHATPMRLTWQGAQHLAFLSYDDASTADEAIEALQGLSIRGCSLRIELAKNQRSKMSNRPRQAARSKGQANEDFGHGQ
ncbi:methenyltetrahydrofolate synthase domain-containing protein isoform X1 [Hemicordylus capensis]|uniref:methenyltetrahydrofolate synthase domain-containing protein isoform X1 n=2 Tax=Hemicordylus capensis TaxID=884348 RepID=UPI00230314B9|nr:methenyltetrahydrofolate synthase domain-containing protein isoform X1 [Hemicordylus capensis]